MSLPNRLLKQNRVKMLLVSCLVCLLGLSIYMLAGRLGLISSRYEETGSIQAEAKKNTGKNDEKPSLDKRTGKRTGIFTAYTSRPQETDNKPYITADQTNLKVHQTCVVANNKLKFGTKIQVEGIGICEVRDRKGRHTSANHFDIYMGNDVKKAKDFGKRKLQYSVVEEPGKDG
jgi:3D (Asp-Asp-Asp) domain-containing protein